MHDRPAWKCIAIAGSAPAPSDIVEVIVQDPALRRLGKLDAERAEKGSDPLVSTLPDAESENLVEQGHMSLLSHPVDARPGDLALYLSRALQDELQRLGTAPVWSQGVVTGELRDREGTTVGFGTKARLDEIRRSWADTLRRAADGHGIRYAREGDVQALGELDRLCRLARYCVDMKTGVAYELWLRIGFAQRRRLETVNLRRTHELVIKRDFGVAWEAFEQGIEDLARHFRAVAADHARRELDTSHLEQRLASSDLPSTRSTKTRPFLRIIPGGK